MRRLSWKAGLAGAALFVTTVYAVAQAGPIYRCEGPTSPSFKSESREKHR